MAFLYGEGMEEDELHISGYILNFHHCQLVHLLVGCRKTSQQVMNT